MTLHVRDPYGNVTEIHPSARPFWEHREGYEVLDGSSDEPAQSVEVVTPAESGTTKRTTKQAATQPAQNVEE
jgi:hypothetical protein